VQVFDALDALVERCGKLLATLLPVMVLLTCGIVLARYLFDLGTIAGQEAVMYLHGIAFMLGFAYALKHNAHVRVDVLANRFSARTRAKIDLAGHLEGSSEVGGIPAVYLLKSLLIASSVLLLLQGLAEIARCVQTVRNGCPQSASTID